MLYCIQCILIVCYLVIVVEVMEGFQVQLGFRSWLVYLFSKKLENLRMKFQVVFLSKLIFFFVGGEIDEIIVSQNYCGSVFQFLILSFLKFIGIFQISVNSFFELVKFYLVGVKLFEVDCVNVVGEVREICVCQKQCRLVVVLFDVFFGNLEQLLDNMEIFCVFQVCFLFFNFIMEVVYMFLYVGVLFLDIVYLVFEKRFLVRIQGFVKCESLVMILWV